MASVRLHVLMRNSERFYERYYKKEFGVSLRECRIIGVAGMHQQVSFKQACQQANLVKSHVSRLVTGLIRRRLIEKIGDPLDQRSIYIRLTEKGRDLHRALHVAAGALNEHWLSALTAEQGRQLNDWLQVLNEQLLGMIANDVTPERLANGRSRKGKALKAPPPAPPPQANVVLNEKMARQLHAVLSAALGEKR